MSLCPFFPFQFPGYLSQTLLVTLHKQEGPRPASTLCPRRPAGSAKQLDLSRLDVLQVGLDAVRCCIHKRKSQPHLPKSPSQAPYPHDDYFLYHAPFQLLVLLLQQPLHRLEVRLEGAAVPVRHVQEVDLLIYISNNCVCQVMTMRN